MVCIHPRGGRPASHSAPTPKRPSPVPGRLPRHCWPGKTPPPGSWMPSNCTMPSPYRDWPSPTPCSSRGWTRPASMPGAAGWPAATPLGHREPLPWCSCWHDCATGLAQPHVLTQPYGLPPPPPHVRKQYGHRVPPGKSPDCSRRTRAIASDWPASQAPADWAVPHWSRWPARRPGNEAADTPVGPPPQAHTTHPPASSGCARCLAATRARHVVSGASACPENDLSDHESRPRLC